MTVEDPVAHRHHRPQRLPSNYVGRNCDNVLRNHFRLGQDRDDVGPHNLCLSGQIVGHGAIWSGGNYTRKVQGSGWVGDQNGMGIVGRGGRDGCR